MFYRLDRFIKDPLDIKSLRQSVEGWFILLIDIKFWRNAYKYQLTLPSNEYEEWCPGLIPTDEIIKFRAAYCDHYFNGHPELLEKITSKYFEYKNSYVLLLPKNKSFIMSDFPFAKNEDNTMFIVTSRIAIVFTNTKHSKMYKVNLCINNINDVLIKNSKNHYVKKK